MYRLAFSVIDAPVATQTGRTYAALTGAVEVTETRCHEAVIVSAPDVAADPIRTLAEVYHSSVIAAVIDESTTPSARIHDENVYGIDGATG
jgi:hypothetical protein